MKIPTLEGHSRDRLGDSSTHDHSVKYCVEPFNPAWEKELQEKEIRKDNLWITVAAIIFIGTVFFILATGTKP